MDVRVSVFFIILADQFTNLIGWSSAIKIVSNETVKYDTQNETVCQEYDEVCWADKLSTNVQTDTIKLVLYFSLLLFMQQAVYINMCLVIVITGSVN